MPIVLYTFLSLPSGVSSPSGSSLIHLTISRSTVQFLTFTLLYLTLYSYALPFLNTCCLFTLRLFHHIHTTSYAIIFISIYPFHTWFLQFPFLLNPDHHKIEFKFDFAFLSSFPIFLFKQHVRSNRIPNPSCFRRNLYLSRSSPIYLDHSFSIPKYHNLITYF